MKKVLVGCLVVGGVLTLAGVGACWYVLIHEGPKLDVTLDVPNELVADQTFEMAVSATNPHREDVTLDSIDIDDSLMEGFQVLSVDPTPTETMHLPFIDQRSWSFGRSVPPGGELVVTFRLRALAAGHYAGSIDVCNPSQDYTSLYADLVVRTVPARAGQ